MPNAEELFRRYLLPLYPPDAAADLGAARATDANPAHNPSLLAHLADAARAFVAMHGAVFGRDLALDYTDASVHRLGAALTRETRDTLAARGAAGTAESELFNVIVHGAAYVGECVVRAHGGEWEVRRPLWESLVRLRSHAGEAELAPLSWWLRSLEDDAFTPPGAGLAERYRAHVEVPTTRPADLPVFAATPRPLPRLHKVRYDVFYKYLKAHLPELRDVGADFPSAERFDAYRFAWLDFFLVGGGRMLVMAGPGEGGLHVFWLDAKGFAKSALFACDEMPEPQVRVAEDGDKLQCIISFAGQTRVHELLWWGP